MIILLIKLLAAHLLGDFLLQSDKLCNKRYHEKLSKRFSANCIHSLIQAALSYCFIGLWDLWWIPLIIFISHFLIDFIKTQYGKKDLPYFIGDQIAHYCVIYLIWYYLQSNLTETQAISKISLSGWIICTSFLAILKPSSILIKLFMEYHSWVPNIPTLQGLPNAGKWIGYLERILILIFIYTHNIEGIGFLLAAKSIFRFGELNQSKDIKVTEYVLIGTFLSFTIAILTGYIAEWGMTLGKEILN